MNKQPLHTLSALSFLILFPAMGCSQETLQMDRIEVQADTSLLEERHESSIAKRIIKGEELAQYGDLNAYEILKRTPGVTVNESKGKKGAPGKGYTKILIDGEDVLMTKRSNPLEQISPEMIERLEVITNGSAEHTAESMGGIVNIVMKKPVSQGQTTAKLTAGSYGDVPMGSLFVQQEGKKGKLSYLVNTTLTDNSTHTKSETHRSSKDEYSDNNTRNRSVGVSTKLIYTQTPKDKYTFNGTFNLSDEVSKATEQRYGTPTETALKRNEGKGWMSWSKLSGIHNLSANELVEWGVKYHDHINDLISRTENATQTDEQNDEGNFRVLGSDASYSIAMNEHFIKTGGEIKHLKQHDQAMVYTNGTLTSNNQQDLQENRGAWYLQDEISMGERAVLTPGIRYEKSHRTAQQVYDVNFWAPSLHFLYKLTPVDNMRASIARTMKLPRLDELSSTVDSSLNQNDLNHPDLSGNPNLKHETALSYEVRYEHFFEDKGIASIGGFYRRINDKIERLTSYESGRYIERPENSGDGKLWSIELELKKSLNTYLTGVGVFGNATFQNSSLESNGEVRNIKGTHHYIGNIGIDHTLEPYHLTYGAAYRYFSGYDDDIDGRGVAESQDGHGALDLCAKKRLNSTYKMGINLKNITQETVTTTTNRYSSGVLSETQIDHEHSRFQALVTLEGRW